MIMSTNNDLLSPISLGTIQEEPQVTRQERADAVANRALILETADTLFAQHSVAAINMADIAKAAGVGKGTLYRRFANKGELCLALMDNQTREFQNNMLARMREMSQQGVGPLQQLDQFLDALVYYVEDHAPLLCEVQRSGLLEEGELNQERPYFWQFMTISGLLRLAQAQGQCRADIDADYVADALLAPLNANIFRFQRQGRGFSLERISTGLRSLVVGLQT